MKTKQKLTILLGFLTAALLFVIAYAPMRAEAATVKGVKDGQTIPLKHEGTYLYKFTVSEDTMVRLTWSECNTSYCQVAVYADKNLQKLIDYKFPSTTTGHLYVAVQKGTYYVKAYEGYEKSTWSPTTKLTFKMNPVTNINKGNYCRAKAIALAAKKQVTLAQTPNNDYTRWYKITLKTAQKVTISTPIGGNEYIRIKSPNNTNLTTIYNKSTSMVTQDKLAAGTYYIVVNQRSSYIQNVAGTPMILSWK